VPRLDFGYASKPENSDSAACIDFQAPMKGINENTNQTEICAILTKISLKVSCLTEGTLIIYFC
jgi:hypothetical protein